MLTTIRKHWLFLLPLAMCAVYYLPQNIIGFAIYPFALIFTVVSALLLFVTSYLAAYRYLPVDWADRFSSRLPWRINSQRLTGLIVPLYVLILVAMCASAQKVPLLASLQGASADALAQYRNTFMRGETGNAGLFNYAFAIFNQALMPLALACVFWKRNTWRYVVLAIFILGTSLSLSKAAFLCIAAPLIALFLMQGRWRAAMGVFCGLVASIAMMYVLASGVLGAWQNDTGKPLANGPATVEQPKDRQVALLSNVPDHYNVFGKRTQATLVANRIIWIPYVTAVDWFRYQQTVLHGDYVLGKSIRPLALIMGVEHVHLERKVAELQWGGSGGTTSNAVFFADAWLNWGPLGVIFYSAILALTIKLIVTSGATPLIAASAFPVLLTSFAALPPVYFSGGLGFLLLFAILGRCRPATAESAK